MPTARSKADVLDRDFLETRSKVLDLAASLDRLDRAPRAGAAAVEPDGRTESLRLALEALLAPGPGRAEAVQRIFSLAYDPQWRERFELSPPLGTR